MEARPGPVAVGAEDVERFARAVEWGVYEGKRTIVFCGKVLELRHLWPDPTEPLDQASLKRMMEDVLRQE